MHDAHHIERIKKKREASQRRKRHAEERKKKEKEREKDVKPQIAKKGSRLTKNESLALIKMRQQAYAFSIVMIFIHA